MNSKIVFSGIVLVLIGIWFYMALSTFNVDEDSSPKKLIIEEGTVRTEEEVAQALAEEMGFDLEGAYKSGYSSMEIAEYLNKEPHALSVTLYKGKYYTGRRTVSYTIPFSVCILIILSGVIMILFNVRSGKK